MFAETTDIVFDMVTVLASDTNPIPAPETRDLNCNLLELAGFKQVCSEPVIVETDKDGNNGLRQIGELEVSGNLKSKRFLMYVSSMLTCLL